MNTKDPLGGSGVAGESFHPDDNYYMNALTFKYEIHVEIHTLSICATSLSLQSISLNKPAGSFFLSPLGEPEGPFISFRRMQSTFSINHLIAPVIRCAHVPRAMPGATIIKPLQGLVLYYHRYSFHPDDNHYMNRLTVNYKIAFS